MKITIKKQDAETKVITYTFILEFRGGTYINQIQAVDLTSGIKSWSQNLNPAAIKHVSKKSQTQLINDIVNENPIAIAGVTNVWTISLSLKVGFFLINIIQTDTD